jgi:DNA-binding transcriptional MerR regulator
MRLIPIDHGMTLPDSLEVCSYDLAWLSYSQSEKAFSQETLDFIAGLDIDYDISYIEKNFRVRPICLRNMKISSLLLKKAAATGLNLAQIGEILCRPDEDDTMPSILEKIVSEAESRATQELDDLQQDISFALRQFQEDRRTQNKRRFPDITVDQTDDFPIRSRLHKSDSFEEKSPLKIALESSLGASTNGASLRARGLTEEEGEEAESLVKPSNLERNATTNLLKCFDNSEDAESDLSIAIELFPDQEEASNEDSSRKIEDVEAGTNGPHDNVFFKHFNALLGHALAAYKQDGCCKAFMEGPKMSSAASVMSTAASEMSFLSTSFTK